MLIHPSSQERMRWRNVGYFNGTVNDSRDGDWTQRQTLAVKVSLWKLYEMELDISLWTSCTQVRSRTAPNTGHLIMQILLPCGYSSFPQKNRQNVAGLPDHCSVPTSPVWNFSWLLNEILNRGFQMIVFLLEELSLFRLGKTKETLPALGKGRNKQLKSP